MFCHAYPISVLPCSPGRVQHILTACTVLCALLLPPQDSPASLTRALRWTYITGGTLTLVLVIAWPLLALPAGVFSKGYFTMWIVIAMIWGLLASGRQCT